MKREQKESIERLYTITVSGNNIKSKGGFWFDHKEFLNEPPGELVHTKTLQKQVLNLIYRVNDPSVNFSLN
jgi:hypothetical protein